MSANSAATTQAKRSTFGSSKSTKTTKGPLLDPVFLRKLEGIDVMSRKILQGKLQGERRSKKRGQSVEFADYRNYVVGDDLRRIDWNLYARLDKLFLRLFMEEEDLSLAICVDTSASMDFGEPNKLHYAKQLAAALGYIGLVNFNRVSVHACTTTVDDSLMNLRGKQPIPQMLDFLQSQSPDHASPSASGTMNDLTQACKRLALLQRSPGIVVLISDFFDKGDLADALRYLSGQRYDTYVIQLLAPQETDPVKGQIVGDLRLRDIEDGDIAEVSVSPELLKRYKANIQAYCQHIRELCARRGMMYLLSETDVPLETMVLNYLRTRGLVG